MKSQQTILLVDDNPANLFVLEEILGDLYQTVTATSGEEALEQASEYLPDLVLLDIMMPGIDGYETCKQLRNVPNLQHTKIVMVSAKAMVSERLEGYNAGADDYITKPFEEEELLAKVRVYLRLKSIEEVDQLKTDLLTLLCDATMTPLHGLLLPLCELHSQSALDADEKAKFHDILEQSILHLQGLFETILTLHAIRMEQWNKRNVPEEFKPVMPDPAEDALALHATPGFLNETQIVRAVTTLLEQALQTQTDAELVQVDFERHDTHMCMTVHQPHAVIEPAQYELPLKLARQIIRSYGGTIDVHDTPDAGTAFKALFPNQPE
ncbi:ATP-binding response regulator [Candidatus Entotheonella palauensis]|uniref:ATP-binding response regulator n=1 Tax=Candidatus Entotheonella palauensis TaxID=93172 RepID=UPI000B7EED09|nr:response regulator [Candidatus Entotheonella palauensis]